jgi:hypothetical protein
VGEWNEPTRRGKRCVQQNPTDDGTVVERTPVA